MKTKFLNAQSLTQRLYAMAALLTTALIGVALYAFAALSDISAAAHRTESVRMPQLTRMADLEQALTTVSLQLRQAMLASNSVERDQALRAIDGRRSAITQTLADFERGLSTARGKALFAELPSRLERFWQLSDAAGRLVREERGAEAFALLAEQGQAVRDDLLATVDELVRYQEQTLRQDIDSIETSASSTLRVLEILVITVALLLLSIWSVGRLLRQRIAASRQVAMRVRDGDLTQPVLDTRRDEFSPLLAALGEMQSKLAELVGRVRGNAESVSTASSQIAAGNADLSARTEQQASALRQTAASMEQINSSAGHNADNAAQARQLAAQASQTAVDGGSVVDTVVHTMKAIDAASRQIVEIIGVIDGIAFQTNILALNAAVEAARAGDQGRGFAVVAAEVRSLAQRSAEAARQIKTLIHTSVERVEQGSHEADRAGVAMQAVVQSIQRVNDIVGEIASASREQMSGVGQVSEAVAQMDQMTQQNAALVEESAAAAESLRGQAQTLVQIVGRFRLESAAAAAPISRSAVAADEGRQPRTTGRATPISTVRRSAHATTAEGAWTSF